MSAIDGGDKRYLNSIIKQTAICSLINLNRGWHEQCVDFSEAKRMERIVWVAVEKFRKALNAVAGSHRIRLSIGHDTVTNFHPGTDVLQFSATLVATPEAALNAARKRWSREYRDCRDTITLSGVTKAPLSQRFPYCLIWVIGACKPIGKIR
jgi:hypothetical protein